MKILGILLMLFVFPFGENDNILPVNSAGKVSFQESVSVEEIGRDALFRNALNYTARIKQASGSIEKPRIQYDQGRVSKTGSFYVYKKGLFTPQLHGEIRYTLTLDVNEEGYSYQFTDFVFQYYEKNRYGVFAPVNGKKKALEEEQFAGMQELWLQHKQTTLKHIKAHIQSLKASMLQLQPGAGVYDEEYHKEMN